LIPAGSDVAETAMLAARASGPAQVSKHIDRLPSQPRLAAAAEGAATPSIANVDGATDPLVDASILIAAHKAWRGAVTPNAQSALALMRDPAYQWVITPNAFKEFARCLPTGSASARRFIRYLERLGNTRVMTGAEAAALHGSPAFGQTVEQVGAEINRSAPGLATRAGTPTGKVDAERYLPARVRPGVGHPVRDARHQVCQRDQDLHSCLRWPRHHALN
jgi:hypothetical protein